VSGRAAHGCGRCCRVWIKQLRGMLDRPDSKHAVMELRAGLRALSSVHACKHLVPRSLCLQGDARPQGAPGDRRPVHQGHQPACQRRGEVGPAHCDRQQHASTLRTTAPWPAAHHSLPTAPITTSH
jgi:hypothetical protein